MATVLFSFVWAITYLFFSRLSSQVISLTFSETWNCPTSKTKVKKLLCFISFILVIERHCVFLFFLISNSLHCLFFHPLGTWGEIHSSQQQQYSIFIKDMLCLLCPLSLRRQVSAFLHTTWYSCNEIWIWEPIKQFFPATCKLTYFYFKFILIILKVTYHLQLLQNIIYIPHVVQYILEPIYNLRYISHLLFPFICWWTLNLFPYLGDYK